MVIRIIASQSLAGYFGAAVDGRRAHWHVSGDAMPFWIVEDRLAGAGEEHFRHASLSSGFKGIVSTSQIHREELGMKIVFVGNGGEMEHCSRPCTRGF